MIHRNRLQSVIEIRAGERSRTIAPGARVDLAEELWPGYPLARAVDPGWFEPELPPAEAVDEPSAPAAAPTQDDGDAATTAGE